MRNPFILAALAAGLAVACGGSQKKEPQEPRLEEVNIDNVETGAPEKCTDSAGEPIECMSDSDCCAGFYCGLDPQGSTRIKTCLMSE